AGGGGDRDLRPRLPRAPGRADGAGRLHRGERPGDRRQRRAAARDLRGPDAGPALPVRLAAIIGRLRLVRPVLAADRRSHAQRPSAGAVPLHHALDHAARRRLRGGGRVGGPRARAGHRRAAGFRRRGLLPVPAGQRRRHRGGQGQLQRRPAGPHLLAGDLQIPGPLPRGAARALRRPFAGRARAPRGAAARDGLPGTAGAPRVTARTPQGYGWKNTPRSEAPAGSGGEHETGGRIMSGQGWWRAPRRRLGIGAAAAALALAVAGLALTTTHGPPAAEAAESRPPNVIVIVADDLGHYDLSLTGNPLVKTPNIDSIGQGGVRFVTGYAVDAVCAPSRAGLLTGRYPQRYGFEYLPYLAGF